MKKLRTKREYERSGYAKVPKANLPDAVRNRKRRKEQGKIFPCGAFPEDLIPLLRRKLQNPGRSMQNS